jgi:hypothetical protein
MLDTEANDLTADELRELIHYDPATGIFICCIARGAKSAGQPTGSLTDQNYKLVTIRGRRYRAHRLAWLYMTGEWPTQHIDHIDRDRTNNRWSNLRAADYVGNNGNAGLSCKNTSGFKGVYFSRHAKRWRAQISISNKTKNLGYFDTAEQAHQAYSEAARNHFGEFAAP